MPKPSLGYNLLLLLLIQVNFYEMHLGKYLGTFKTFFPKIYFAFFANWAIDGAHYTFHENWFN